MSSQRAARRTTRLAVGLLAVSAVAAGCGLGSNGNSSALQVYASDAISDQLTFLAAGLDIHITTGNSTDLVNQARESSDADILVLDDVSMSDEAQRSGLLLNAKIIAYDRLIIVVRSDSPKSALADIANARIAVCDSSPGCKRSYKSLLLTAGLSGAELVGAGEAHDVVKAVLNGSADAGIIYETDAYGVSAQLHQIAWPEGMDALTKTPIVAGLASSSKHHAAALAYLESFTTTSALAVLESAGFQTIITK